MILAVAIGLAGGFVAGVCWREAWELIRGRDTEVELMKRIRTSKNGLLMAGLIVSMVFTGIVGVFVMFGAQDQADLTECFGEYNERVEDARNARTDVADDLAAAEKDYLDAELRYQRGLLAGLEDEEAEGNMSSLRLTIEDRIQATEEYREQVYNQKDVRDSKPYPPTALCEDYR